MSVPHDSRARLPLNGRRVLLTRTPAENRELRTRLQERGATVLELPAIAIVPPDDPTPLDLALRHLEIYQWIAVASRNAVDAVFHRIDVLGLPPALPEGIRVAAVGESTAAELRSRGVRVDCVPERASGAALAAALAERDVRGARVLVPAGDLGRRELPEGLRRAGAQVDEVVVYRTVPPRLLDAEMVAPLLRGEIDVIAFASPSAVHNLVALVPTGPEPLRNVRLACMGPTTAAAVRELGMDNVVVAPRATLDGLMEAIEISCATKDPPQEQTTDSVAPHRQEEKL